jgi:hypothetical protein
LSTNRIGLVDFNFDSTKARLARTVKIYITLLRPSRSALLEKQQNIQFFVPVRSGCQGILLSRAIRNAGDAFGFRMGTMVAIIQVVR